MAATIISPPTISQNLNQNLLQNRQLPPNVPVPPRRRRGSVSSSGSTGSSGSSGSSTSSSKSTGQSSNSTGSGSTVRLNVPAAVPMLLPPATPISLPTDINQNQSQNQIRTIQPPSIQAPSIQAPSIQPASAQIPPVQVSSTQASPIQMASAQQQEIMPNPISGPSTSVQNQPTELTKPTTEPSQQVSGLVFENNDGPLPDQLVEEQLASRGFIATDKILTKYNDQIVARYLRVITNRGQIALIDLDTEGKVSIMDTDVLVSRVPKASSDVVTSLVPYSVKTGAMNCAQLDVCGVALECTNQLCVLSRSSQDLTPKEIIFSTSTSPDQLSTDVKSSHITSTYPIVKMSEVIENPNLVIENIDRTTRRLQNVGLEQCHQNAELTERSFSEMVSNFSKVSAALNVALFRVGNSISELDAYRQDYQEHPPTNDIERQKYQTVILNLRRRNDMLNDLTSLCQSVNDLKSDFDSLSERMMQIESFIRKAYQDVDVKVL